MKNWKKIKTEYENGVLFNRETMHDQIDYGTVVEKERKEAEARRRYRPSPLSAGGFRIREDFKGGLYDSLEDRQEPPRKKWWKRK